MPENSDFSNSGMPETSSRTEQLAKQIERQSGVFAISTFKSLTRAELGEMGVELSDRQLSDAFSFGKERQVIRDGLEESKNKGVLQGYTEISKVIEGNIYHWLADPSWINVSGVLENMSEQERRHTLDEKNSIEADPSGVNLIELEIRRMKEEAWNSPDPVRGMIAERRIKGAELAYQQYIKAVDHFLEKWGEDELEDMLETETEQQGTNKVKRLDAEEPKGPDLN